MIVTTWIRTYTKTKWNWNPDQRYYMIFTNINQYFGSVLVINYLMKLSEFSRGVYPHFCEIGGHSLLKASSFILFWGLSRQQSKDLGQQLITITARGYAPKWYFLEKKVKSVLAHHFLVKLLILIFFFFCSCKYSTHASLLVLNWIFFSLLFLMFNYCCLFLLCIYDISWKSKCWLLKIAQKLYFLPIINFPSFPISETIVWALSQLLPFPRKL